jgi:hypothetical protein
MRRWLIALALLAICSIHAETLSGVVSGPDGPLGSVELRVRSAEGAVQDFTTAADGVYRFNVAPGSYDLFVVRTGYSSTKRAATVAKGANVKLDFALSRSINEGTPGEYPSLSLRDRTAMISGPVPRAANGTPDLSGVWLPAQPTEFEDPPMKPWAAALAKERMAAGASEDPRAWCLPSGTARTNHADLTKFVQTPDLLVILIEGAPPGFRQIFLNEGAKHPDDLEPSWMGHSIGHWDGDTLVVDTVGFNNRGWIDGNGRPQTEKLHVTERFHRMTRGILDVMITIDDPGAYEKPWSFHRLLHLTESEDLREAICNEGVRTEHYVKPAGK